MKTRIAILLMSAVVLLSFTVIRNNKSAAIAGKQEVVTYQSGSAQAMTDRDQFN